MPDRCESWDWKNDERVPRSPQEARIDKISDVGMHAHCPFAVMQYLAGGSLDDRKANLDRTAGLTEVIRQLQDWLPQIAQALDFIHGRGFIHRDIKPANI